MGRVAAAEGIDCHFNKGGTVVLARSPAQLARARAEVEENHQHGFDDRDIRLLSALIIYGQRTADDRFAFGGRGAPYHYGSAIRPGLPTALIMAPGP